jgi:hypothetical protein
LKKTVLLVFAAMVVAGIAINIFDPDSLSGPDADQQEKAVTKCLRAAGFTVESEIPPYSRFHQSPEYEVKVRLDGNVIAYVYLFDFPDEAGSFVDDARLDAEDENEKSTIKQRGPAAVDLDSGARTTPVIRDCVDKAAKPPPDKK